MKKPLATPLSLASAFVVLSLPLSAQGKTVEGASLSKLDLKTPSNHGGIHVYAFSPDGKKVAGASWTGTATSGANTSTFGGDVFLWDPRKGKITKTLGRHDTSPIMLAFSADGKTLVSYSNKDHTAKVWKTSGGKPKAVISLGGAGSLDRVPQLSGDGKTLVHLVQKHLDIGEKGLDIGHTLEVWDLAKKKLRWSMSVEEPNTQLNAVFAISPDSKTLAVAARKVHWREENGRGQGKHSETYQALLSLGSGEPIWRVDVEKGDRSRPHPSKQVAFTPDGAEILMVGHERIQRYSARAGKPIGEELVLKADKSIDEIFFDEEGEQILVTRFFGRQMGYYSFPEGELQLSTTFEWPRSFGSAHPSKDLKRVAGKLGHDPVILDLSNHLKK